LQTGCSLRLSYGGASLILLCALASAALGSPAELTKAAYLNMFRDGKAFGRSIFPAGTSVDAAQAANGKVQVTDEFGDTALLPADAVDIYPQPNPAPTATAERESASNTAASAIASPLAGVDLKTANGRVYMNARAVSGAPDAITYSVTGGMVTIPFNELPENERAKYHLTAEKAAAFERTEEAAAQKEDARKRDEANRAMAADLDSMARPIREVESDMPSYINTDFVVHGTIEISSTYLWGYGDAQGTHYAFTISDGPNSIYCYGPKGALFGLHWKLLTDGPQKGRFVVRIKATRFMNGQTSIAAELPGPGHLDSELAPY
jgi:hypothetical protein